MTSVIKLIPMNNGRNVCIEAVKYEKGKVVDQFAGRFSREGLPTSEAFSALMFKLSGAGFTEENVEELNDNTESILQQIAVKTYSSKNLNEKEVEEAQEKSQSLGEFIFNKLGIEAKPLKHIVNRSEAEKKAAAEAAEAAEKAADEARNKLDMVSMLRDAMICHSP